jgi:hypothetical protein
MTQMLEQERRPLRLRDFQDELMHRCSLRVSRPWLGRYLREVLNATYRQVKPISAIHNSLPAKLQRQYAASKYIEALHAGHRVISIDESVIRYTDHRLRGWLRKDLKNQTTSCHRLNGVNLIAALCSDGELLYTVNVGKTNSLTFSFFLSKLCDHLDSVDVHWR